MLSVWCPQCAKNALFPYSEGGQTVLCRACGAKYLLPSAPLLPPWHLAPLPAPNGVDAPTLDSDPTTEFFPVGTLTSIGTMGTLGTLDLDRPLDAEDEPVRTASRRRHRISAGAWAALAVVVCSLAVLVGMWVSVWAAEVSRSNDRAAAGRLMADGQALLTQGKLQEARAKFDELNDFVAYRQAGDPLMRRFSDAARAGNQKIAGMLANAPVTQPAVAATNAGHVASAEHPLATTHPTTSENATQVASSAQRIPAPGTPAGGQGGSRGVSENSPPSQPSPGMPGTGEKATAKRTAIPDKSNESASPDATAVPAAIASAPVIVRPSIEPVMDTRPNELTDEQIGQSIQHGVDWLVQQFDPKTFDVREGREDRRGKHMGLDALAVYALLQCGEAINDSRLNEHGPFIKSVLNTLKRLPTSDGVGDYSTYARSLRATALALLNRPEDHEALRDDVAWLLRNQHQGAYTYGKPFITGRNGASIWDNSNSQYGLLGVWSAAETGFEVPSSYWMAVQRHWETFQGDDGGWDYVRPSNHNSLTMTCAGVASLLVCHDWIDAPHAANSIGKEPFRPALQRGLDWLEQDDRIVSVDSAGYWGYALYGIERVGLASGFKYFGTHNWYPELCRNVLHRQSPGGAWGGEEESVDSVVETSYALLFLSRGRHPIIMNKLRFNGAWANHPRDLANLARWTSGEMERPLNWQVVPLNHPWTDWTDSPILSISSHEPIQLSEADIENLRGYVNAGGILYLQADGDSHPFDDFAHELAHRLYPQFPMTEVPPGHPLFSSLYNLASPPVMRMVSNGSRILMLYSPQDLSKFWNSRDSKSSYGKPIFQLGADMFIYAAGKRDLRNRLDNNTVAALTRTPRFVVNVARVRYDGNWDPEPYAWQRFANWFQRKTGYGMNVQAVDPRNLDPRRFPFAHMTGTARYNPSAADFEALRRYVAGGGVLLIDSTGGAGEFDQNLRPQLFSHSFSTSDPIHVGPEHPLMSASAPGMDDLSRTRLRAFVREMLGGSAGVYLTEVPTGRGHVILAPLDITSGLLNTNTWGILGYDPAYAQNLMKNLVLWTLDGQKDD